ncbi:hypothetical protein N7526_001675 [Penicillium atrosanguineum]|nr:hypothetical protein N7526_001675 [Penicillium atrosanguineum]
MPYYNEENPDEPDPVYEIDDAKTIQMDSPGFWNAVDKFDPPAIPDSSLTPDKATMVTTVIQ